MNPIAKAECKLAYKERRVQLQLIDCRVSTASRHCFSNDVCKYILLHLHKIATVQVFISLLGNMQYFYAIQNVKSFFCVQILWVQKKNTFISFSKYSGYSKHKYAMFFLYKITTFVYIIIVLRIFHKHLRMVHHKHKHRTKKHEISKQIRIMKHVL